MTKRCSKCKETKPAGGFYRKLGRLSAYCKECSKKDSLARYHADKERGRAVRARWYRENREAARYAAVRRDYGLEPDEYDAIIARGCAICGTHDGRIGIDHHHDSGGVRAALCTRCNCGIGQFRDDPELLCAAMQYVQWHQFPEIQARPPADRGPKWLVESA